jgi:N-acetylmuramoyl-L-alanine amidase
MRIFLNNGHHLKDSGAVHHGHEESQMAIELGNSVALALETFVEVLVVPDDLNLKDSIKWVNDQATEHDFAFSTHFNSHNNQYVRGTEVYYANTREKELAITFAEEVSKAGGFKNRGPRHDSATWVGSLGWLRNLKCDSVLLEVCYLTNHEDMVKYDTQKVTEGIVNAIKKIIPQQVELPKCEELEEELALRSKLVDFLVKYIISLNKK